MISITHLLIDLNITTPLTTLYNDYVADIFNGSPLHTYNQSHPSNNQSHTFDILGWDEPAKFQYTEEGSMGIIFTDLVPKPVNVYVNRMYYNIRQPDFNFMVKFLMHDYQGSALKAAWDDEYLIAQMTVAAYQETLMIFSLSDFKIIKALYRNTWNAPQTDTLVILLQDYSRPDGPLLPCVQTGAEIPPRFNGGKVVEIRSFVADTVAINNTAVKPKILSPSHTGIKVIKAASSHIGITNHKRNDFTDLNRPINTVCDYTFFIEGIDYAVMTNIKPALYDQPLYNVYIPANGTASINGSILDKIYIHHNNYYRILKNDSPIMIRGYIGGTITLKDCANIPPGNQFILCFREYDNLLIGKYPVINSTYNIPNLDINTFYNIILIDESRTVEWMVSSHRKPAPYDENNIIQKVPSIINDISVRVSTRANSTRTISWTVTNNNYNYFIIYVSSEPFTYEERYRHNVSQLKITGLSYIPPEADTRNYYIIECIFNNIVTNYKMINIQITPIQLEGVYSA